MSHSITSKLNQAAREHQNQNGVTFFFVSLGEKNYDFKTKTNVYTNYDAALFAKDAQIDFYRSALVEGAVIEVSGTGVILDASDPNYKPKLILQDAKLGFVHNPQGQAQNHAPQQSYAPQQQAPRQQAPQQQMPQNQAYPQTHAPQQPSPQQHAPQNHAQQQQQNYQNNQQPAYKQPQKQTQGQQQGPAQDFDDDINF